MRFLCFLDNCTGGFLPFPKMCVCACHQGWPSLRWEVSTFPRGEYLLHTLFGILIYLLFHLFIHFLSAWTHGYFIYWVIIQYNAIYFVAHTVLPWSLGIHIGSCISLTCPHFLVFEHCLIFWSYKIL